MGNHMENAIEQMQRKEEAGLNLLYSKTYNYVYLRAKSLLSKEADVQNLMKEVYLQAFQSAAELKEDMVYEWLGKRTYAVGTKFYRKKKAREATCLEIEKNEFSGRKNGSDEEAAEVLGNALEHLPELYQATFYAFYYDYMSISDIAETMDCSAGVILNRLNYTTKFLKESFAMHNEECAKDKKVVFTVENICHALRKWSVEHCLGMASAQTLYANLCKELKLKAGSIYLEGKEFAGVNNTVVYHKADDFAPILAEVEAYRPKETVDKKKIGIIAVVAAVILLAILLVALSGKDDEKKPQDNQEQQEQQEQQEPQEPQEDEQVVGDGTAEDDMTVEPEPEAEPEPEPEVEAEPEPETEPEPEVSAEDYLLPTSSEAALTEADLSGLTKEELRFARNEIYARYGVIFGVQDLDEYFAAKSWYEPTIKIGQFYDQYELSEIEEKNVAFISNVEQNME